MSQFLKFLQPSSGPTYTAGVGDILLVPENLSSQTANALVSANAAVFINQPAASSAAKFAAALATLSPATSPAVDSTGGTPTPTAGAIVAPAANATTSLTADMTAVKNALSFVFQQLAALQTLLANSTIGAKP